MARFTKSNRLLGLIKWLNEKDEPRNRAQDRSSFGDSHTVCLLHHRCEAFDVVVWGDVVKCPKCGSVCAKTVGYNVFRTRRECLVCGEEYETKTK